MLVGMAVTPDTSETPIRVAMCSTGRLSTGTPTGIEQHVKTFTGVTEGAGVPAHSMSAFALSRIIFEAIRSFRMNLLES